MQDNISLQPARQPLPPRHSKRRSLLLVTITLLLVGLLTTAVLAWQQRFNTVVTAEHSMQQLTETVAVQLPEGWRMRRNSESELALLSPDNQLRITFTASPRAALPQDLPELPVTEQLATGATAQHTAAAATLTAVITAAAPTMAGDEITVLVRAEPGAGSELNHYRYEIAKLLEHITFSK